MSGITIEGSVTINRGVYIGVPPPPPILKLSLDADTYVDTTSDGQQNVSGTSDNVGFFPYGWPGYSVIQPGWTCVQTGAVVSAVGNGTTDLTITTVGIPFTSGSTYTFTSANTWFDSVSNLPFILHNGVTYSSDNGGNFAFVPSGSQYAQSPTSLSSLNTWTVEAWHYYTGTNAGSSPCIITELYTGGGINYALGSLNDNSPALMAGWYNGGWNMPGYTLTAGNWYQIIGTYDGQHVKLYVNNTLVEQVVSTGNALSSGAGINLMRRWDNAEFWGGNLAIVKVYENAMTAADVNASWDANKARFGLPSFTLTSADIDNNNIGLGIGCEGDSTGFSIGGDYHSTGACYNPTLTAGKQAELEAFWNNNGLTVSSATYLFDVTWGPGSSTNTTRNVMVIGSKTSYLVMGTVDTNVTGWDSPGQNPLNSAHMKAANGTFLFPATFTLISPTVQDSVDWC